MRRSSMLPVSVFTASVCLSLIGACSREREGPRPAEPEIAWSSNLDEAKIEAQKTGDRILASFEAYWCPWSRRLRESLYVNPAVIESLAAFKCVSVNADRDTTLCQEYDIRLFPTIVVMDPYGGEIERMIGYHSADEFIRRLSSIRQRDALLSEMFRKEEQSTGDPRFLMDFGDLLRNMGTYGTALMRYERAAELDKGNKLGIYEEATYAMAECRMLAGEYRQAGNGFRFFAESNPSSEKRQEAIVLAALCYEQAKDRGLAAEMFEEYLRDFRGGDFAEFASERLGLLRGRRAKGN